jgi:hypothetical protein
MDLITRYFITVEKLDSFGDLFRRVVEVLASHGKLNPEVRFLLEESGLGKISPVQRAIKAVAQLERFRSITERPWEPGKTINILTNLDNRFDTSNRKKLCLLSLNAQIA